MMNVKAHRSARLDSTENINEGWEDIREHLGDARDPKKVLVNVLTFLGQDAQRVAAFQCAFQPSRHEDVVRALRIRADVEVTRFELAAHPGETVDVAIDGQPFALKLDAVHGDTGPSSWLEGIACALAAKHATAVERLVALGTEEAFRRGRLSSGDVAGRVEQALAFRALVASDAGDARAWLARARDELGREKKGFTRRPVVKWIVLPQLALLDALASGDARAFNDALAKALEAHKAYWTRDSDERLKPRDDSRGWLALVPLGVACLAHGRGMPVEVESEYVPSWLVRGD